MRNRFIAHLMVVFGITFHAFTTLNGEESNDFQDKLLNNLLLSSEENVVVKQHQTVHVQAAPLQKIGLGHGRYQEIVELDLEAKPDEIGERDKTVYSCKHHDPCVNKYHPNRTYYSAYRPAIFILCYKYDFCIELACPVHFFWNNSLSMCVDLEEMQELPNYQLSEEAREFTSVRTRYDMTKYDCVKKYPCKYDSFFSPKSVYRHVDPSKFIYCLFWDCQVYDCPDEMNWFQDIHRCLIPIDYENMKPYLKVTEEHESHEEHIQQMKFGFSNETTYGNNNKTLPSNFSTTIKLNILFYETSTFGTDNSNHSLELFLPTTVARIKKKRKKTLNRTAFKAENIVNSRVNQLSSSNKSNAMVTNAIMQGSNSGVIQKLVNTSFEHKFNGENVKEVIEENLALEKNFENFV